MLKIGNKIYPDVGTNAELERAAGMGLRARGGVTPPDAQHPDVPKLESILYEWATGRMPAKDVQKQFKEMGWSADLRRGRYEVEAVDPNGTYHYLKP